MTDIFPDDYAAAEIGVFWDIEHCTIPDELNAGEALKNIKSAISSGGHRGPVSIRAYGNMTGHELRSITSPQAAGEGYEKHTKMLEDIVAWSAEHPQPSNLMLMVGNTSIHLLESRKNYLIHRVQP